MTLERRSAVSWLAVVGLVLGLLWFIQSALFPRYEADVTDLGRDLAGAAAVNHAEMPYQRLGELADTVPGLEVPASARDQWVAHSPLSIAAAWAWDGLIGDRAEETARVVVFLCTLLLAAILVWRGARSPTLWAWIALAAAVLLSLGAESDLNWVQGASLLALLLLLVRKTWGSGNRTLALALLGIIVAWRPWCAPLALFLPDSESPARDGVTVAFVACLTTVAVLPVIGGWSSLIWWLSVALPENGSEYLSHPWNMAILDSIWPLGALVAVAGFLWLGLGWPDSWESSRKPLTGAVATLGFLPVVWPHYWIGLIPFLVPSRTETRQVALVSLALLGMAVPLVGGSAALARFTGLLALIVLTLGVLSTGLRRADSVRDGSRSTVHATMEMS